MAVRLFALIAGAGYSILGICGLLSVFVETTEFVPEYMYMSGVMEGFGNLFGAFPINTFEGFVYAVIGLAGITAYAAGEVVSRLYAQTLAVWLGLFAVLGVIPIANTLFGLMPIYGNDVWLHLGTAVLGAYLGFAMDKGRPGKDPSTPGSLKKPFDVKGAPPYASK